MNSAMIASLPPPLTSESLCSSLSASNSDRSLRPCDRRCVWIGRSIALSLQSGSGRTASSSSSGGRAWPRAVRPGRGVPPPGSHAPAPHPAPDVTAFRSLQQKGGGARPFRIPRFLLRAVPVARRVGRRHCLGERPPPRRGIDRHRGLAEPPSRRGAQRRQRGLHERLGVAVALGPVV